MNAMLLYYIIYWIFSFQISNQEKNDMSFHFRIKLRQPTPGHVETLLGVHRTALEILKKVAECCIKEAESWAANVSALAKARQAEAKTQKKEEEKERKRHEAALKKQQAKEEKEKAKAEAKESAAKEAAANNGDEQTTQDGAGGQEKDNEKKSRQRNRSGQHELVDEDPELLREMFKLPLGAVAVAKDVKQFIEVVADAPDVACVARLSRGPVKKVLTDTWPTLANISMFLVWVCRCCDSDIV